ncbi:MAG: 4-alpha-glucanotransferase [Candidatus Gastranaerophilales bacterium]|nr:4-alpha-glucanotransferase [Candidatus Gastranaerophilales bacterium]
MKLSSSCVSFKRQLSQLEKIEARAYAKDAKKAIGLENLALVTHSVSFPSNEDEDIGIGILSLNQGAISYVNFLYDNAIDSLSIEPMGYIKKELYSPYDGSLLSKKPIIDFKELTSDKWANIFEMDDFNKIVQGKNYNVEVPNESAISLVEFDKNQVIYDYVFSQIDWASKVAFENFKKKVEDKNPRALELNLEFEEFKKENEYYLKGDSIYYILSLQNDQKPFLEWENPLHRVLFDDDNLNFDKETRNAEILRLEEKYSKEIELYKFCQFVVNKQQKDFVEYASRLGQYRYESDLKVISEAYLSGKISKEKFEYLKLKLLEYKTNFEGVNIIGDKQVGYGDMDIFSNPSMFTKDEFMGAPPNLLKASKGQDWDFPFIPYENLFNKDGTLGFGGEYLKKNIKKAFKDNVGGLRIDHIIGLIDAWTYKKEKQDSPLSKISDRYVASGSRHLFKYILNNYLPELEQYNLTQKTIIGVIDPIGGIFDENSLDRKSLIQNGVFGFDKIQEIFLSKKEIIDEVYSSVVEKIILDSAREVIVERNEQNGIKMTKAQIDSCARQLLLCEDLGALTLPVKKIMEKYDLIGLRDASRSNPYNPNHHFREGNPQEQGNYWLISTHDTLPYKELFKTYDKEKQGAHIDYVASELGLDSGELKSDFNFAKFFEAKVLRVFSADKNPKTPNNVMLNWLDLFAINKPYNTPGLYDKTKNWNLRVCSSQDSFEKIYYEKNMPQSNGINILKTLSKALAVCGVSNDNAEIKEELDRLGGIIQE